MACKMVATEGGVFSVWGNPTKQDVDAILTELRAARARAGAPTLYVTRVPVDAPPPADEVRRYLDSRMGLIIECCAEYHVILEGTGFFAALKRGVLLSLFQMRWRQGTFFVHASLDDLARTAKSDRRGALKAVLDKARSAGIAMGAPPVSMSPPR